MLPLGADGKILDDTILRETYALRQANYFTTIIMLLRLVGARQTKLDTLSVPLQLDVQVKMFILAFIGGTKFQTQTK